MPKIPQIQRQNVGGIDFSLGDTTDVELGVAKRQARGIEALGSAIGQIGDVISVYDQRRKRLNRKTAEKQSKITAAEAAQKAYDDALTSSERDPDGGNLVELAEKSYNESRDRWLDGLDDDARAESEVIWREAFLSRKENLLAEQRKEHFKYTLAESDKIKDGLNTVVSRNPNALKGANKEITDLYQEQATQGLITENQRIMLTEGAVKGNAVAAINSLMRDGKFDEAEKRVLSGDMSDIFGTKTDAQGNVTDEKQEMVDIIRRRKVKAQDDKLKEINLKERQLKENKKKQREATFTQIMGKVISGEVSDEELRRESLMLVSTEQITRQDHNFIESVINKTQGFDDDNLTFKYTTRMMSGEDLNVLRTEVVNAVNSRQLSADEGTQLLKSMQAVSDKKATAGTKTANLQLRNAKDNLDAIFGSKEAFDRLPGRATEKRIRRNMAGRRLLELMSEKPNANPIDLSDQVVEEFGGVDAVLQLDRVPGVKNQNTAEDLDAALVEFNKQFRAGGIPAQKFNELVLQIKARKEAIEGKELLLNRKKFRGQ